MARKTLLTEAEIRSFMKLAELRPIGTGRIEELYGDKGEDFQDEDPAGEAGVVSEEDELERELGATEDELGAEDSLADEEGDEIGDLEADLDAAPEGGAGMVSVDDFMGALEAALEDVLGDEVEVEMDDEEGADDDVEMDMDMEAEPGGMELDMAVDAEDDAGERDPLMEEEDIVNEVARRVAARLQQENNKSQMVDQLAERILNRLTSK
jgi:hypothetical protein